MLMSSGWIHRPPPPPAPTPPPPPPLPPTPPPPRQQHTPTAVFYFLCPVPCGAFFLQNFPEQSFFETGRQFAPRSEAAALSGTYPPLFLFFLRYPPFLHAMGGHGLRGPLGPPSHADLFSPGVPPSRVIFFVPFSSLVLIDKRVIFRFCASFRVRHQ